MAQDVQSYYSQYHGFVVLHGTDTMAYTASALSFMLQNLGKPVILTGSQVQATPIATPTHLCTSLQVPISELRNDARDNILGALILAGEYVIPEVNSSTHTQSNTN